MHASKLRELYRMLRLMVLFVCFFTFVGDMNAENLTAQQCQQRHCIAVIDAGSTGTRLHIYAYDRNESNNPVNISEVWSKKIEPGLATLKSNPETIHSYLNLLFTDTPVTNIPVYFYATAGMRLLSDSRQAAYYQILKGWFESEAEWELIEARTITGGEEGLFDWLAINYKLGTLSNPDRPLAGVMDMGGASVQIVFPVSNTSNISPHDIMEVDVYGQHHKLFVRSFLGLGQVAFSYQFLNAKNCFANEYLLPDGTTAEGNADLCQSNVSKLINGVHEVGNIVQSALAEKSAEDWYVIGGLNYLLEDKPFHFEKNQFTSQALLQQADTEICSKQWQDLSAYYPENDYMYAYCLFPSYYYALMVNGYGLPPNQPIHYLPKSKNIDWTMGVVLHRH